MVVLSLFVVVLTPLAPGPVPRVLFSNLSMHMNLYVCMSLDYRGKALCCLLSFGSGHFYSMQHGHLVSSRLLHPVPQHPQPMAALLLLTFHTSGGLSVAMVTWQSFSQHGVCSDASVVGKSLILPFLSCDNYDHTQNY